MEAADRWIRQHEIKIAKKKTKVARALALNTFWNMWSRSKTYDQKIYALRWAEKQRFNLSVNMNERREHMRHRFNQHKHRMFVLNGNQDCRVCGNVARVRHHIIALNNGGRNQPRNIMLLCGFCHLQVHPWMKFEVPEMAETMARVEREPSR